MEVFDVDHSVETSKLTYQALYNTSIFIEYGNVWCRLLSWDKQSHSHIHISSIVIHISGTVSTPFFSKCLWFPRIFTESI